MLPHAMLGPLFQRQKKGPRFIQDQRSQVRRHRHGDRIDDSLVQQQAPDTGLPAGPVPVLAGLVYQVVLCIK